ncbi:hypothetical protein DUNSADRAFT_580 [Dunaliella salina]|uniref:SET domain-containing protein n=1 Tax=Dunaliella salina TaxID=3046 RepID=A0ABQ7GY26_DUNSA|nr:hypothetical protein DUNSADRAFT_580 [Dunaliella salina]|eukprot:KAF5839509.1 hypothetical protein DUNSADRAFT_580 [Dunaliella salina]
MRDRRKGMSTSQHIACLSCQTLYSTIICNFCRFSIFFVPDLLRVTITINTRAEITHGSMLASRSRAHGGLISTRGRKRIECKAIFLQQLSSLFQGKRTEQQSFGNVSSHMLAWYLQRGLQPGPLELKDCGAEGRGLVASTRIKRGQRIVHVPSQTIITSKVAVECSSLKPLLQQQQQQQRQGEVELPAWSLLALFLAELRYWGAQAQLHSRTEKDNNNSDNMGSQRSSDSSNGSDRGSHGRGVPSGMSEWLPYLEALPDDPGTVLSWPRQQVQGLLQGSPLLTKALSITNGVAASFEQLHPIIKQAEQEGLIPEKALDKEGIFWAFGILLSRLVRLSGKDDEEALVPWADFLNHSPHVGCHLDWDSAADGGQGAVVLYADTDYQAGQQVYISYGERTAGQLLLSYGFCPNPSTHPHEAYLLQLGMREADPLYAVKARALSKRGFDPDGPEWPLKLDGLPAGIVAWAAFRAAGSAQTSEAEIEALATMLFGEPSGRASSPSALAGPLPYEDLGLQELGAMCGALLKGYPTSMEQDRATASGATSGKSQQPPGSQVQERQRCTAAIRVVERQILARTQFIASSQARAIRKSGRR